MKMACAGCGKKAPEKFSHVYMQYLYQIRVGDSSTEEKSFCSMECIIKALLNEFEAEFPCEYFDFMNRLLDLDIL